MNTITVPVNEWNKLMSIVVDIQAKVSKLEDAAGKELLTPKEVCALLKIGRATYQRYIDKGILTQIRISRKKIYVSRAELQKQLKEGKL